MSDDMNLDPMTPLTLDDILAGDVDGLLDAPEKPKKVTSSDRLERAFLEIVEFRRAHGRVPSSTTPQIGERKLGARLDGILANEEKLEALKLLDTEFGLLKMPEVPESFDDLLENDDLGLLDDDSGIFDVSDLPVRRQIYGNGEVARRKKAEGFEQFAPLFEQKHSELRAGESNLVPYAGNSHIKKGAFFVLKGVMCFIAEVGEPEYRKTTVRENRRERLRVIFENGTESAMYKQSLSIRMYEQEGLMVAKAGVETDEVLDADVQTGHIYVLQSMSEEPQIAGIPNLHKIGFTTTTVAQRIKNSEKSPTFLMAPVKVVEDYTLYNIKASTLEHLLHRVFAEVRLNVSQAGVNNVSYDPAEWFVVPRKIINQAISMIKTGEIIHVVYDAETERFVER